MLAYLSGGATRTSDPSVAAHPNPWTCPVPPNPGASDEDRDRRRRRVGSGGGVPAAPRSRGDSVRVRPTMPAVTPTRSASTPRTRHCTWTAASSSSTTATTPASNGCWRGSGSSSQPSVMSFSVSDGTGDFEYSSGSPNGLFAKRAHLVTPWFHRMIADLARFNRAGPEAARSARQRHLARRVARAQRVLAPVRGAADRPAGIGGVVGRPRPAVDVPGSVPGRVLRQPRDALSFLGRPRWRAIRGGSFRYVEALTSPFVDRLRLNTPVQSVSRAPDHVLVSAARMRTRAVRRGRVRDPLRPGAVAARRSLDREHEILGSIPYQANEVVVHTDERMLPRRRRAWASWNYHLLEQPGDRTTVTYHMNRLQSLTTDTSCASP